MSYRTPAHRVAAVTEARNVLLAARRTVLTTHLNADGDGAGSEAALASWLRAHGTEAWIVNPTPFPDAFRFLVEDEEWIVPVGSARARDLCDSADLAVVLDTGEVPRVGRVWDMIRDLPVLVVDHHPTGDHAIGGTSLRDSGACATGELVFDLVHSSNGPWPDAVAHGVYAAILTDTGGFRFDNTTAQCHLVAAEVVARGAKPQAMHERVYGSSPIRKYRLLRHALDTLERDTETGVSWMVIPQSAYDDLEAGPEDLEGLVDIPRSIEGTKVGLLFRSITSGEVKISFRSNGPVDVNTLARTFGGGGHVRASGAVVPGPMDEAVARVLEATRAAVARTKEETG